MQYKNSFSKRRRRITLEHSQISPKTKTKNFECLGPK